ncbi:MAG: SIMPL domain-containing protein [Curvibacter sp.]
MTSFSRQMISLLLPATLALLPAAQAQPIPRDVVQFAATATLEARQDQLSVTLRTTREGSDPGAVQQQLKAALDAALAEARPQAQPGALDVRSGAFSLFPRSQRDGRISVWQGTAELILSGTEIERIAALAGRIQGMTVAQTAFGLSREQRELLEQQAQAQAIERFRARATEIARGFGFSSYSLREIHINSQDQGAQVRPRFMALEAKAGMAADAPLPVEAGQAQVQVTVSGSVQLK